MDSKRLTASRFSVLEDLEQTLVFAFQKEESGSESFMPQEEPNLNVSCHRKNITYLSSLSS